MGQFCLVLMLLSSELLSNCCLMIPYQQIFLFVNPDHLFPILRDFDGNSFVFICGCFFTSDISEFRFWSCL